MNSQLFGKRYYEINGQDRDRPALLFYTRLVRTFFKTGRILDFGCGTGFFINRLRKYFITDGFEISSHARVSIRHLLPGAQLFSNLKELPHGSYVGITALHVLEHISDDGLGDVFKAWRNTLLPGGRVLCVVPELDGLGHRIKSANWIGFKDPSHINLKTREEWLTLFTSYGFTPIKIGTDGLWDFPYKQELPRIMDICLHSPGTILQYLLGRLVLSAGAGESLILLVERQEEYFLEEYAESTVW